MRAGRQRRIWRDDGQQGHDHSSYDDHTNETNWADTATSINNYDGETSSNYHGGGAGDGWVLVQHGESASSYSEIREVQAVPGTHT
jgi:hypothetical protein